MFFGTTVPEFISFIHQVSLSVTGAASLWGLVFYFKLRRSKNESSDEKKYQLGLDDIVGKIVGLVGVGVVLSAITWLLLSFFLANYAASHVGIVITPVYSEIISALELKSPILILSLIVALWGIYIYKKSSKNISNLLLIFFGIELILLSILVSVPAWSGDFGREQFFHFAHNWHSILTLGTVIVIDYLFHISERSEKLRRALYPNLDTMSKAIWIGLAVEVIGVYSIFSINETFLTDKFFFMQTLIGIIIINGVLLAGPMSKKLESLVNPNGVTKPLRGQWKTVAGISGVLSIVSWVTITFVDSFKDLSLSLESLFVMYGIFLIVGYVSYLIIEKLDPTND